MDLVKKDWPDDMRLNSYGIFRVYTRCCGVKNGGLVYDYLPYVASAPNPSKIIENLKQALDIVFS